METNVYLKANRRCDLLKELTELTKEFDYLKSFVKKFFSERKEIENSIRESEAKYKFMFDRNPQPNWIYDRKTLSFLEVNEAAIEHYGYSRQEFMSMTLMDIYPKEDVHKFINDNSNQSFNQETKVVECTHIKKNGECMFVEIVSSQLPLNGNNLVHTIIHDITARKRMENKLLESELNFRRSISDSPMGIHIVTVDGKTIYANRALLDIYELNSLDEFLNLRTIDRYTAESYIQHQERKAKRLKGQDDYEYEISFKRTNGEVRHIKVSRKEVLWDGVKHFQVITQDVTEQRNAEENLRIFLRVVEQSPNSVYITNADGSLFYVNSEAVNMTGYSKEELLGGYGRVLGSESVSKNNYMQLWETVNSGGVWSGEVYNKKKNGEGYWEYVSISPIFDDKGKITHVLSINVDITDKKNMYQDLIHAKESTEKSEIFLRTFIENMPFDVWVRDVNSVGILENKMHVNRFGSIIGKELKHSESLSRRSLRKWEQNIKRVLKGEIIDEECDYKINDRHNNLQQIAFPIYREGKIIGIAGINIDITDRKLAENALIKSEEQLRKFASHLQDVREAERSALAREIHDDLGQILVALKIDTGLLKQKIMKNDSVGYSNDILVKFDSLANLINDTIKTVRRIMNGLRPEQLEMLGLKAAIKEYMTDFGERYQLNCKLKFAIDELDINQRQTLALFRILQEAMTNISKYAKASAVTVMLTHSNDKLMMEIADNGIGFDIKRSGRDDSYGMIGMRERVLLLKGKLQVASKVGRGTRVKVEMPYR